jgi:hypothetical protein
MGKLMVAMELQPDGGVITGTVEPGELLRVPLPTPVVCRGHTYTAVEISIHHVPEQEPATVVADT